MCLGDIGEVVGLPSGERAVVRTGARRLTVSLLTLAEPVAVGDVLLVHSGYALARLSPAEAAQALAIRAEAAAAGEDGP